jgi:alpha-tubulin suppressor-like RCC1 family protein
MKFKFKKHLISAAMMGGLLILVPVSQASEVTPMVSAGNQHTVALKSDGTVVEWGFNFSTSTINTAPVAVAGLNGVTAVSTGYDHTVALKSDGTVVAWGMNTYGQLGDGTTTKSSIPIVVPGLSGVVAVSASQYYTVALKSDGTVVAWGWNAGNQLGDGTTINRYSPVKVLGLYGVTAVSAGTFHAVALKSDGTVVAWGLNNIGQLGDGTTANFRSTPVNVLGLSDVIAVSAGLGYTVALKANGTVVAWGFNTKGQLGDGTNTNRSSPVAVIGPKGVVSVSAGFDQAVALSSTGIVMSWGNNDNGQLGVGDVNNYSFPLFVFISGSLGGVSSVSAGTYQTMALTSNGTVVAWGLNVAGGLGNGTTMNAPGPVPMPVLGLNIGALTDDRMFAFAEGNYPNMFPGAATDQQFQQYIYRYYPASGNYLAIDTSGVLSILGPSTRNVITPIAPIASFGASVTAWEVRH